MCLCKSKTPGKSFESAKHLERVHDSSQRSPQKPRRIDQELQTLLKTVTKILYKQQ